MPRPPLTFDDVRALALKLPDVTDSTMRGAPSLKARGKLLICPALHKSAEPDTLVVSLDLADRAKLLTTEPKIYYLTAHYLNYPLILVRLTQINRTALKKLLAQSWQFVTTKPKPTKTKTSKPR